MERARVFSQYYLVHHHFILRFCTKHVINPQIAEELCSECFLIAWKKFNPDEPFSRAWLFQVARNLIGDRYRKAKSDLALFEKLKLFAEQAGDSDETGLIMEVLEELTEAEQQVLRLSYLEELSAREIAEVLDCSEQAVWKRVSRAKSAFKRKYLARLGEKNS